MDITYIPMARGFVYLAAVIDWFSRKVLAWRLSITMDVGFCIEAVEEAMARFGKPEIFNTDQGSQFTSRAFTTMLIGNGIAISMDGKGAWRDNHASRNSFGIRRAPVAVTEARGGVSARLRVRLGGAGLHRALSGLLQPEAPSSGAGWADARSGLHRIAAANPGGSVTKGRNHLSAAQKLFKQTEPLLWLP